MVKAEIIESPEVSKETELIATDNVPNVDVAIEQWDAYQKLCKGLLNETDYQEIIVKEKDENGNYVKVKRHFKKKSAWQKLKNYLINFSNIFINFCFTFIFYISN